MTIFAQTKFQSSTAAAFPTYRISSYLFVEPLAKNDVNLYQACAAKAMEGLSMFGLQIMNADCKNGLPPLVQGCATFYIWVVHCPFVAPSSLSPISVIFPAGIVSKGGASALQ